MTTNYHTPITGGAAANAAVINAPLAALDSAIGTAMAASLLAQEAILTGGTAATLANGAANYSLFCQVNLAPNTYGATSYLQLPGERVLTTGGYTYTLPTQTATLVAQDGGGGRLHVDQSNATGGMPVLYLDQGDDSEDMIEFAGTVGVGNAIEAVGAKTLTTTHFIKVTITGVGERYLPVGTIA